MTNPLYLSAVTVNSGEDLNSLSHKWPLLVVFLRHSGCPFCREALDEISHKRAEIEELGTKIVLVHMMDDASAKAFFAEYHLDDVYRVSDPEQEVYRAFGVPRGNPSQVMGPGVWWRGFQTTILSGHLPGMPVGDILQLPGAYLVHDGQILRSFEATKSSDRPDYVCLSTCPLPSGMQN